MPTVAFTEGELRFLARIIKDHRQVVDSRVNRGQPGSRAWEDAQDDLGMCDWMTFKMAKAMGEAA